MIYLKLLSRRLITDEEMISRINELSSDEEIISYLQENGFTFKQIIDTFEDYYGIQYIDIKAQDIPSRLLDEFNIKELKKSLMIPYDVQNGRYVFASNNIIREDNFNLVKNNTNVSNLQVKFNFAFEHEILKKYEEFEEKDGEKKVKTPVKTPVKQVTHDMPSAEGFMVTEWVDNVLNKGIKLNASDIHIESREGGIQLRYRIDGILSSREFYKLNESQISNIIVRFKLISGMDISEKRKPQDGRISQYDLNSSNYDLRVSSINTNKGEKIVLRIFNRTQEIPTFKELGFLDDDVKKVEDALSNTNGVIYIAGATGSGKTTTLYSMIDYLNSEKVNIYTIEDPIEKELHNINQIQIDTQAGITFPSTLKSLLRQDPDIIVVGEVRDVETARLSISASLTGHLVISTMHANNAIDSISRLFEMEIEPFLLGTSSLMFMSQKLIRKLCPNCKQKIHTINDVDGLEKLWVERNYQGIDFERVILTNDLYTAVGCDQCTAGYRGRTAIGEFFPVNKRVREMISQKKSIREIEDVAIDQGFKNIHAVGLEKVMEGITSIDELIRQLG